MRAIEDIMESNTFRQHRTDGVSAERALVLSAGEISRLPLESDTVTPDNRRHADAYAILSHLDEFIHGVEAMRHHHHVERLDKKDRRSEQTSPRGVQSCSPGYA